jgi:1-acyl-sn-glycerol-3-phosphate acyltransferase
MGKLFYHFCKNYVNIGLYFFFKKIKVVGKENILEKGAVLFVANHQNALLDALLIATRIQRETHFVARADVFKRPFIKKLLALFYMMPIYRIGDGRQMMSKNDEIFENCKQILLNEGGLMIFPEGNHNLQRRLRPLSKGFTRIVFSALDERPTLKLKIVPVGINYTHHQSYRGSVSLYFGEPIEAADYINKDFNIASLQLKEATAAGLKKLTTHVEGDTPYEEQIESLEATNPDYLNPFDTNLRLKNVKKQSDSSFGVHERNPLLHETKKRLSQSFYSFVMMIFKLPILINNLLPLAVWRWVKKKVEDPVMVASIKFGIGITVFPIFYLLQSAVILLFFGEWMGVGYLLLSVISLPLVKGAAD